jgi:pimeloyl-ACP methyl ester carboxylesterase
MDIRRSRSLRILGFAGIGLFLLTSLAKAQPSSCSVPSPGTYCDVSVGISPFATGGPFGGFQSESGTGVMHPITVTFSPAVASVSATALDPDFPGNRMDAFDTAGALIGSASFTGDGRPGVFTTSTVSLAGAGIARVVLVPAPAEYVAYNLSFTPSATPKLQAIDPYPALIGPDGVTSDPERRAVQGKEVTKAAADGATLLLLRASGLQPGQVVFSVDSGNTNHDGGVSADGSQRLASVSVPVVQTSKGMEAFAFYWVPDNIDPAFISQRVPLTARLVPASGAPSEKSLTITLFTPPVLLVHGIWSDAGTWNAFPLRNNALFQVTPGDYKSTHAHHFSENRIFVQQFIEEALEKFRSTGGAATRVDYVAHSMGGILGRLHTQLPYYRNPLNFGRGNIHKLLTLDTPHTGTPAALLALLLSTRLGFVDFCRLIGMPIDEGAVEDLATGSAAIAGIAPTPLPAHALVGTGGSDLTNDVNALSQVPGKLGVLYSAFKLFLGPLDDIFGGMQHDALVDLRSQQGGMPPAAISPFHGFGSLHTRVTQNGEYSDRIIDLLLKSVTDTAFSNFPAAPRNLGFAARSSRLALSNDSAPVEIQGALRIDLPAGSSVLAGGSLPIAVSAQNGFVPVRVAALSLASSRLFDAPPFTTTLDIPQDAVGDLLVLAVGVDAAGASGYSGIVTIHVQAGSPLDSLEAMDATPILFGAGDSRSLAIVGHFDDGVLRDVTSPTAGTTYVSTDPGIVTVSDSGLLTAVAPGETEVVVENAGVSTTVAVTVLANRSPLAVAGPDLTVECSSPAGAAVALNGGVSADPDGDPLTFAWSGPFGSAIGATPTVTLPLGASTIQLTVDDGRGGASSDTLAVAVRDTTAPVPRPATASPSSLWPPNHKMVAVTVQTSAQDACTVAPSCAIQSVTANEPIDSGAVEITGPLSLKLRSERLGGGSGRIYTLTIACRDSAGNTATTTATVRVPHDQGH